MWGVRPIPISGLPSLAGLPRRCRQAGYRRTADWYYRFPNIMKEMIRPYRQDTFCKTYEDERLTEYAGIFADRAESRACRAGNGDTAADTGKACNKCRCEVSETGRKSRVRSYRFRCLNIRTA